MSRRRTRVAVSVSALGLGLIVLSALFAPWIAPASPSALDLDGRLRGPSSHHPFGQDELGRDILSRLLFGARSPHEI